MLKPKTLAAKHKLNKIQSKNEKSTNENNYTDRLKTISFSDAPNRGNASGYSKFLTFLKYLTGIDFDVFTSSVAPTLKSYSEAAQTIKPQDKVFVDPKAKELNIPTILSYGDAIIIKHRKYGFYWIKSPVTAYWYGNHLAGRTDKAGIHQFHIAPGTPGSTWGSGVLETPVKTGSDIKFIPISPASPNDFSG